MTFEELRNAAKVGEVFFEMESFSLVKEDNRFCSIRHKISINHKAGSIGLVDLYTTEEQFRAMCKIFDSGKTFGKTLGRRDVLNQIRNKVHEVQRILGM